MEDGKRVYFLERARTSLNLAHKALDPAIAAIHMDFYRRYVARADQEMLRPRARIVVRNG